MQQIFLLSIVFAIIWFVVSIVWNLVNSVRPTTPSALLLDNTRGYAWFFGLLIVNLIIMVFIIGFYYYKTQINVGPPGPRGYPGIEGEQLTINNY